jgi:hypothetical protein
MRNREKPPLPPTLLPPAPAIFAATLRNLPQPEQRALHGTGRANTAPQEGQAE